MIERGEPVYKQPFAFLQKQTRSPHDHCPFIWGQHTHVSLKQTTPRPLTHSHPDPHVFSLVYHPTISLTHRHTHTHADTCTHRHTHTHTCTHTHTAQRLSQSRQSSVCEESQSVSLEDHPAPPGGHGPGTRLAVIRLSAHHSHVALGDTREHRAIILSLLTARSPSLSPPPLSLSLSRPPLSLSLSPSFSLSLSLSLSLTLACGRGFYKSSSQDLQCSRCPAHSFNDREGSGRCDCEDGYYRAPIDPPSVACTRK